MAAAAGYALFDTAIGACGIAWNRAAALVGLQLPEASPDAARSRLRARFPTVPEALPPAAVRHVMASIAALLAGEPRDLSDVPLDLDGVPDFNRRVYDVTRAVPAGRTLTYGDIARQLGDPMKARDVGQALGRNPLPIVVPCHRVVAARGKLGGFSARGGAATKRRMLMIEQARTGDTHGLFD